MSLSVTNNLNNLFATAEIIINNIADLQNLLGSYLTVSDARGLYQLRRTCAPSYSSNPTDRIYYSAKCVNSLTSS